MGNEVTLDFTKAKPLKGSGVTLDFSKGKPLNQQNTQTSQVNSTQTNPTKSYGSSGVEGPGLYPAIARGAANTFGIDHKAIDNAYSKEGTWGEWKELAGQVLHNQLPAVGKSLARIGASTATGAAIGSVVPGAGTGFGAAVGGATQTVAEIDKAVEPALKEALGKIRGSLSINPPSVGATGIGTPSISIGNRDQFAEGLTQFLGTVGMMASGSEKPHDVHGSVKLASDIAKKVGADEAEAVKFADKTSTGWLGRFVKHDSFFEKWRDAKGLEVRNKLEEAKKAIHTESAKHAQSLDNQIDTSIPSGVIDAQAHATTIKTALTDIVKAPEKTTPRVLSMLKDAESTSPGQWTFAKARQFRSSIGSALGDLSGPQKAVASEVYGKLTEDLAGTAKKYGLEKTWEHYNELESQFHGNYGKFVNDVLEKVNGDKVFDQLKQSKGFIDRLSKSFSRYGFNADDLDKALKFEEKYSASMGRKTLWKLAHGTTGGAIGTLGAYAIGAPYMLGLSLGALTGYAATEITNGIRAAKLSPAVLEKIIENTKLPGKMDLEKGVFPKGGDEPVVPIGKPPVPPVNQSPTPKPTPAKPKTLQGVSFSKEPPKAATVVTESTPSVKPNVEGAPKPIDKFFAEAKKYGVPQEKIDELIASTKAVEEAAKPKEPKVTKVPEGQHGTGKLAEQAKARERVDKLRKEKGSTAAGGGKLEVTGDDAAGKAMKAQEAAQALSKVQSQSLDVKSMQIPELEEALKNAPADLKEEFSGLRKMRATGDIDTGGYLEGLRYYYRELIEGKASSGTPEE